MKTRRLFGRLVRFIAVVILLCLAVLAVTVYLSKRDLDKYRAELEVHGEVLEVKALQPRIAPAPDNGGQAAVSAMNQIYIKERSGKHPGPLYHKRTSDQSWVVMHKAATPSRSGSDTSWTELTARLLPFQNDLDQIRKIARAPTLSVDIDYAQDRDFYWDYLSAQAQTSQLLSEETMLLLHKSEVTRAIANVETQLSLWRISSAQPKFLLQRCALAFIANARNDTWEILQADHVDDSQLATLQKAWAGVMPHNLTEILRMERALALRLADQSLTSIRNGRGGIRPPDVPLTEAPFIINLGFKIWQKLFRYSDKKDTLQLFQTLIDSAEPSSWQEQLSSLDRMKQDYPDSPAICLLTRLLSRSSLDYITNEYKALMVAETMANMATTAIALKRYQLKHDGSLPPMLDTLVPEYLPSIPIDPVDGKPLRYKPEGNMFSLYALRFNKTDDGGDQSLRQNSPDKDLVWPRPAKPSTP